MDASTRMIVGASMGNMPPRQVVCGNHFPMMMGGMGVFLQIQATRDITMMGDHAVLFGQFETPGHRSPG